MTDAPATATGQTSIGQGRRQHFAGYASIAVAAMLFGVAGALAKVLFIANIDPLDLTAVRSFVAGAAFLAMMLVTDRGAIRLQAVEWPWAIAAGVAFTAVNVTFYLAISMISVATAITLEYTAPIFVLVIGFFRNTHRLSLLAIGIVGLGITGCILLTGSESEAWQMNLGVLVGLSCGVAFALYNMIGNAAQARGVATNRLTLYCFGVSSAIWVAASPFLTIQHVTPTAETLAYIGFIGVVATVLPYWLLLHGLKRVDALPATMIGMFDPIVAGAAAYILIGETMTPLQIIGIILIMAAIFLMSNNERRIVKI